MKYIDHLRELRNRIIFCFFFLIFSFLTFLFFSDFVAKLLLEPLYNNIRNPSERRMIFTGLPEVFTSNLKISLFASFLFSLPFFITQFVFFVSPALYKKEKFFFIPILFLIPILFFIGVLFSYYFLIPVIWNFFLSFENFIGDSFNVELESRYSEYMKLTMYLLFASGISFLFPILLIFLTKIKILNVVHLKKYRKYFIIGILIFSAIFTPPDIISQVGIAIPLLIFYELSIIFIKIFILKKNA